MILFGEDLSRETWCVIKSRILYKRRRETWYVFRTRRGGPAGGAWGELGGGVWEVKKVLGGKIPTTPSFLEERSLTWKRLQEEVISLVFLKTGSHYWVLGGGWRRARFYKSGGGGCCCCSVYAISKGGTGAFVNDQTTPGWRAGHQREMGVWGRGFGWGVEGHDGGETLMWREECEF